MRLSIATLFRGALFSQLLHVTASFITLSQRQQISGFSTACSNAYDTPLTKCSESDFEKGNCSLACVALLEEVSALINTECEGTKTYANTLIGLFFKQAGVAALCPNAKVSDGSSSSSGGNSASSSGGGQMTQTTAAIHTSSATPTEMAQCTKTKASTTKQNAQTTTAAASSSTTSSLLKSTVFNTPAAVRPTINSASTLTQSGLAGLRSSVAVASVATTSTSSSVKPKGTNRQDQNDRNGNSGSNGGTPFDITSSSSSSPVSIWMLVWALGLIALIRIV